MMDSGQTAPRVPSSQTGSPQVKDAWRGGGGGGFFLGLAEKSDRDHCYQNHKKASKNDCENVSLGYDDPPEPPWREMLRAGSRGCRRKRGSSLLGLWGDSQKPSGTRSATNPLLLQRGPPRPMTGRQEATLLCLLRPSRTRCRAQRESKLEELAFLEGAKQTRGHDQ
jgi:hypothetical protein